MEITKSTLLLLFLVSSFFLSSSFVAAVCVPRNATTTFFDNVAPSLTTTSSSSSPSPISAVAEPPSTPYSPSPVSATTDSPFTPSSTEKETTSTSSNYPTFEFPALPFHIDPRLKQICDQTDYATECFASITPFLTGHVEPISVLKMEIQALHRALQHAMEFGKSIYEGASASVKDSLDVCFENYDLGISNLDDALEAIVSHDIGRLNAVLSASVSYSSTCEDAFVEEAIIVSPMRRFNDRLERLASNALAIASLLHWN